MNYLYQQQRPVLVLDRVTQSPYDRSVYITVTDLQHRASGSYTILPPEREEPEYFDVV